jgi:uncharacterized protein YcnI
MRKLIVVGTSVLAMLIAAGPALAHVTVQPSEGVIGSFSAFVIRAPNERDNASTTKIEVEFPPLPSVSFMDVPGWERSVEMRTLDEPLELFGEEITEVVGTVTWEGGDIGPGEFQEFPFSIAVPEEVTTLEFPAIQTYDNGEVVRWIGPPDSEEPAALVSTVDLGAGEGQGPLSVLADVKSGSATGEEAPAEGEQSEEGEEGAAAMEEESSLPLILGWIGVGLGAIALVVALTRRRA